MFIGEIGRKRIMLLAAAVFAILCGCCSVSSSDTPGDTVTDVIIGHNNKGPYMLSWTNIDARSVVAVINGRSLKSSDYGVDTSTGMLSFSSVLLQDAIVRFTYRTTANSKRTAGATKVPITLNVFNRRDANLQLTGMHVQDSTNPEAGKTIVGLAGEKNWAASKLNSQFMVSQENDAQSGGRGNSMDRSALKLGGETKAGAFRFTGSLLSVGSEFGGQKEYGVAAGRRQSDFAVHFTPSKRMEASASINNTRDTAGATQGTGKVVQQQNLTLSPTDTTKVSLAHTTTTSQIAAGSADNVIETSAMNLNQKIGDTTSATVSLQNTTANTAGQSEATTTQKVSVTSKPCKQVSVAASHTNLESDKTGAATDTSVTFKVAPLSNMEIKGNVVEKNAQDLTQYQRNLSLSSSPVKYARVTAVFSQKGINDQNDVTKGATLEITPITNTKLAAGYKYVQMGSCVMTITDYSASSKPVSFMQVSGSYRDREVRQDYAPDTTAVQVAITPFNFFSLRGGYKANPENARGEIQNYEATTAGVKFRVGTVGLSADLSQKDEYNLGQQSEEHIFGLEMPAFGRGKLTTGYKNARYFGVAGVATDTYSMGYRHDLGSVFNLSLTGHYTQYRSNTADPGKDQYDAQASVGIKF